MKYKNFFLKHITGSAAASSNLLALKLRWLYKSFFLSLLSLLLLHRIPIGTFFLLRPRTALHPGLCDPLVVLESLVLVYLPPSPELPAHHADAAHVPQADHARAARPASGTATDDAVAEVNLVLLPLQDGQQALVDAGRERGERAKSKMVLASPRVYDSPHHMYCCSVCTIQTLSLRISYTMP